MDFIVYKNDKQNDSPKKESKQITTNNSNQFIVWDNEKNIIKDSPNQFIQHFQKPYNWGYVDQWIPLPQDQLFKSIDKAIILPVSQYYGYDHSTDLDYFIISPKRCYNKPKMREHIVKYLNYFEAFYDTEHELIAVMSQIKYLIDYREDYTKELFFDDIRKYILYNDSILNKLYRMNEMNYKIELVAKEGKSVESLQYNTRHGKILMQMSILMNMIIPLVCHFIHINKIDAVDNTLLEIYDDIICMSDVDIFSKFYETTSSEINRNKKVNNTLWDMQSIRGRSVYTQSFNSIENIILNIMPKYKYEQNIISFNFVAIKYSTKYKITDKTNVWRYSNIANNNPFKLLGVLNAYLATT